MMLATMTKIERLAIDENEASALASAIKGVLDLYEVPAIAPAALAWINLAQTAGMIYGPRVIAARADRARRPAQPRPAAPMQNGQDNSGAFVRQVVGGVEMEVPVPPGARPPEGPRQ